MFYYSKISGNFVHFVAIDLYIVFYTDIIYIMFTWAYYHNNTIQMVSVSYFESSKGGYIKVVNKKYHKL